MEMGRVSSKTDGSEGDYKTPANWRRTHRKYWEEHKGEINAQRRAKYREDIAYRQRILDDNARRASQDREGIREKNRRYREANKDQINARRKLKRKFAKIPVFEYPISEVVIEDFDENREVSGLVLFLGQERFIPREVEDSIRKHFEAYFGEFFPNDYSYVGEALRVNSRGNFFGIKYVLPEGAPLRGREGLILRGYSKLLDSKRKNP